MAPHSRGLVWMLLLAALAAAQAAATQPQADRFDPSAASGNATLFLVAALGPGVQAPAEGGPQLFVATPYSKGMSCSFAPHQTASISVAGAAPRASAGAASSAAGAQAGPETAALEAAALRVAAAPPPGSRCSQALPAGLYTLQATEVPGARWPAWKCYGRSGGNPGSSNGTAAGAAAAAAPAAVPMFADDASAVVLEAGRTYTCVATFTRREAQAAGAVQWGSVMSSAVGAAARISQSECPALKYTYQPPRGTPPPRLYLWGNRIRDSQTDKDVELHGINWFGFNLPSGMVNGLWAGGTDVYTDLGKIAFQIKMLGYNAVRLPFAYNFLRPGAEVRPLVQYCRESPMAEVKKRVTDPEKWEEFGSKKPFPANPAPLYAERDPNRLDTVKCNSYLPWYSNEERLLFVIQQFIGLGLYVVLDYHPHGLEPHAYDVNTFVTSWAALWKRVTCLPHFYEDMAGRIFVDLFNEPDSMVIRWHAQRDRPGLEQLYLATMDALWEATPHHVLFFVEGAGQVGYGLNWGNGFVTSQQLIDQYKLSDPNPFFKQLVKRPYRHAVVITPHIYPNSAVNVARPPTLGAELWQQVQDSALHLQTTGYCGGGDGICWTFPVVLGEMGSAEPQGADWDWQWDFLSVIFPKSGNLAATAYNSQPVAGWFWWAYNENAPSTGGIVKNRWRELAWAEKIRHMIWHMHLVPWYYRPDTQRGSGQGAGATPAGTSGGKPSRA